MQQIPLPNANDDNDDDDGGQPANLHDQAAPDVGLRYRDYYCHDLFLSSKPRIFYLHVMLRSWIFDRIYGVIYKPNWLALSI